MHSSVSPKTTSVVFAFRLFVSSKQCTNTPSPFKCGTAHPLLYVVTRSTWDFLYHRLCRTVSGFEHLLPADRDTAKPMGLTYAREATIIEARSPLRPSESFFNYTPHTQCAQPAAQREVWITIGKSKKKEVCFQKKKDSKNCEKLLDDRCCTLISA